MESRWLVRQFSWKSRWEWRGPWGGSGVRVTHIFFSGKSIKQTVAGVGSGAFAMGSGHLAFS